jgi:hypothetical protein
LKTLDANQTEILERLALLREESPRRWGKMTSHQMIVHLRDAFLCPLGEKAASTARVPIPRGLMKFGALYFPMKWPRGVPTRPEMEQGVGGTLPVSFDADLEKLVLVVERFVKAREFGVGHPVFGAMSEKDWMRWGYLHCDHHLRQFGL